MDEETYNRERRIIDREFQCMKNGQICLRRTEHYPEYFLIRMEGAVYLSRKHDERVLRINLMANQLGNVCVRQISTAKWINLKSICLSSNNIQSICCKFLTRTNWKKLQDLSLSYNQLDSRGIAHLMKADYKKLIRLNLQGNKFQHGSIKKLNLGNWSLQSLMLYENRLNYCEQITIVLSKWNSLNTYWAKANPFYMNEQVIIKENVLKPRFALLQSINMR